MAAVVVEIADVVKVAAVVVIVVAVAVMVLGVAEVVEIAAAATAEIVKVQIENVVNAVKGVAIVSDRQVMLVAMIKEGLLEGAQKADLQIVAVLVVHQIELPKGTKVLFLESAVAEASVFKYLC